MSRARIIGWSHSAFGKSALPDTESLIAAILPAALDHAGIGADEVDSVHLGVFNGGFQRQGFQAALVALADAGLRHTPATRYENACATGSAALYAAVDAIDAGRARIALVVGAEKMTATPAAQIGDLLLSASYLPEEGQTPAGFAGLFGQIADRYFQRHGDQSAALAMIAAKNHANGARNPLAHFQKDLGFDACNAVSDRNPRVSGPLRRSDCSPVSDGAAVLVLADADAAQDAPRAVALRGRCQANDFLPLSRRDPLAFDGARRAWAGALGAAGLGLGDLHLVETHDCFTIAELLQYEAMGLTPPGAGARAIADGWTTLQGRLPVNPSGGLKARGHPIGATGVSQHVMAAMQLCDQAGAFQVPGAALAGVFNMGGVAVANYCTLLERVR